MLGFERASNFIALFVLSVLDKLSSSSSLLPIYSQQQQHNTLHAKVRNKNKKTHQLSKLMIPEEKKRKRDHLLMEMGWSDDQVVVVLAWMIFLNGANDHDL